VLRFMSEQGKQGSIVQLSDRGFGSSLDEGIHAKCLGEKEKKGGEKKRKGNHSGDRRNTGGRKKSAEIRP